MAREIARHAIDKWADGSPHFDGTAGRSQRRLVLGLVWLAAILGVLFALLFSLDPELDLKVARHFYRSDGRFIGSDHGGIDFARRGFQFLYYAAIAITVSGLVITRANARRWLTLGVAQWLFVAVSLGIGPGLVVHGVFKDNWGRARPHDVIEFGGAKAFRPHCFPSINVGGRAHSSAAKPPRRSHRSSLWPW
jgi:lipid A 4'-phosphatase